MEKYHVKTALAAVVCVSRYDKKGADLPNTVIDRKKLHRLFGSKYKYHVMVPMVNNKVQPLERITLDDFEDFIESVRDEMSGNAAKYDALFFAFSGHGLQGAIVLSDGGRYDRVDLYKYFNGKSCRKFKSKLKVLILDACKGADVAAAVPKSKAPMSSTTTQSMIHSDDNIIVWESNSDGYVSYDFKGKGGALMQAFTAVMAGNDQGLPLHVMRIKLNKQIKAIAGSQQLLKDSSMGIEKEIVFGAPGKRNGGGKPQSMYSDFHILRIVMDRPLVFLSTFDALKTHQSDQWLVPT